MDQVSNEEKPTNYYQYVFKNAIKSDLEIVLQHKVIKAHKEVLAQQNPVFSNIFISDPAQDKIEILDLDSNAVEVYINYLYTGKISSSDVSVELYLVAHKYFDLKLKSICRETFVRTLTIENAVKRVIFFLDREETEITKKISCFIARNYNDVKKRPSFNQIFERHEAISAIFDVFGKFIFKIILIHFFHLTKIIFLMHFNFIYLLIFFR